MKFKELSQKSTAELQKELASLREQSATLRVKNRLGQVKGTHQLKAIRKDIARVMTALMLNA